jgi:hypothetical protein
LRKNLRIYQNREVTACPVARAILRFLDGSVLKTGADDEVVLDDYVYDRRGGRYQISQGCHPVHLRLHGRHGLSFTSPVATIGIRGTYFWVG